MLVDRSLEGGRRAQRAAALAIELANDQGGLVTEETNRRLGLVACDYQSAAQPGAPFEDGLSRQAAVLELGTFLATTLRVEAIVGPSGSSETEALYTEVSQRAGVVLVTPAADAAALTTLDSVAGLLWRTVPPDSAILGRMAESIAQRGLERVLLIAQLGPTSASASELQRLLMAQTPSISATVRTFGAESDDLITIINEASSSDAQELVFLGDHPSDAVRFLEVAVGDERLRSRSLMFNAVAFDPAFLAADAASAFGPRGAGEDMYRVRVAHYGASAGPTALNFRNFYRSRYGNEDPLPYVQAAAAWDATWMLLYAEAYVDGRADVILGGLGVLADGLRGLLGGAAGSQALPFDPSNWRSGQVAMRERRQVRVDGASGALAYDLLTEEIRAEAAVSTVVLESGQWTFRTEAR